jgi:thiosulfate reductase cytochrome b subunit
MIKFYLTIRKDHPIQGKHNALQRMAYFSMPLAGVMAVVTGLAIWKPVELAPLTNLLGGYAWARYWHFWAMLLLVILTVGHIFMVFTVDPYSITSMVTGGYREDWSPEARNARPFVHLLPQRRRPLASEPASPRPGNE